MGIEGLKDEHNERVMEILAERDPMSHAIMTMVAEGDCEWLVAMLATNLDRTTLADLLIDQARRAHRMVYGMLVG